MNIRAGALRTGWPWLASALVVLVTGTVVVVANTRDDGLATPTGRFLSSDYTVDAPVKSYPVSLPIGVLTVQVTEALARVGDSPQWRERRPPEDGSFVGITTQLRQTFSTPATADAAGDQGATPVEIAIVADGRRYPVRPDTVARTTNSPPAGARLSGYLAVAGSPRNVVVEVGFDGQRQTVNPRTAERDPGRFADLTSTTKTFAERECGRPAVTTGFRGADTSCIVENSVRVPWVAGLGWAPAGQTWQAVAVYLGRNLSVKQAATGRQYYSAPYGNTVGMTLAGRPSRGSVDENTAPPERRISTSTGLFLVPRGSGPATVRVSVAFPNLVPGSDQAPATQREPSVVVSWKVAVS